jgi:Tol biopolymer transport system component
LISLDGRFVVFSSKDPSGPEWPFAADALFALELKPGAVPVRLPQAIPVSDVMPVFSPDHQLLLSGVRKGESKKLYILSSLTGAEPIPLDLDVSESVPVFAPDGQRLFWAARDGIGEYNVGTGDRRLLTSWPRADKHWARIAPVLSPDGQTLFAATGETQNRLISISIETGATTTLAERGRIVSELSLSPDGLAIAFVEDRGAEGPTLQVVETGGARAARPLLKYTDPSMGIHWEGNRWITAVRAGTPSPYRSQDGLYRLPYP